MEAPTYDNVVRVEKLLAHFKYADIISAARVMLSARRAMENLPDLLCDSDEDTTYAIAAENVGSCAVHCADAFGGPRKEIILNWMCDDIGELLAITEADV